MCFASDVIRFRVHAQLGNGIEYIYILNSMRMWNSSVVSVI